MTGVLLSVAKLGRQASWTHILARISAGLQVGVEQEVGRENPLVADSTRGGVCQKLGVDLVRGHGGVLTQDQGGNTCTQTENPV